MDENDQARTVRCDVCGARLLDTTGEASKDTPRVIVWIKCWRCKQVRTLHLHVPEYDKAA